MADFPPLTKILEALSLMRFDVLHAIQRSATDFDSLVQAIAPDLNGAADNLNVTSSESSAPGDSDIMRSTLVTEFPESLERVLQYIADTGDGRTPVNLDWEAELRPLVLARLAFNLRTNFNANEKLPNYPNTLSFTIEEKKSDVVDRILSFSSCPFTIQRLCELMCRPTTHYKRIDRYLRAVERVITISSTIEFPPIGDSTDLSILMPAQRFAAQLAAGEIGEDWLANGVADGDEDDFPSADVAASAMLILRGPSNSAAAEPTENSTTTELTLRPIASATPFDREHALSSSSSSGRARSAFHDDDDDEDEPAQPTDNDVSGTSEGPSNLRAAGSAHHSAEDSSANLAENLPLPLLSAAPPPPHPLDAVSDDEPTQPAFSGSAAHAAGNNGKSADSNLDAKPAASFDMFAASCEDDGDDALVGNSSNSSSTQDSSSHMPSVVEATLEAETEPSADASYTLPEPRRDSVSAAAAVYIPSASSVSESFTARNVRSPSLTSAANGPDIATSLDVSNHDASLQKVGAHAASSSPVEINPSTVGVSAAPADESAANIHAVDSSDRSDELSATHETEASRNEKPSTPPSETQMPADVVPFDFVFGSFGENRDASDTRSAVTQSNALQQSGFTVHETALKPMLTSTFTAVLMQPSQNQRQKQLPPTAARTDLDERMEVDDEENNGATSQVVNSGNELAPVAVGAGAAAAAGDDAVMQDDDAGAKTLSNPSNVPSAPSTMDLGENQQSLAASSDEPMQS